MAPINSATALARVNALVVVCVLFVTVVALWAAAASAQEEEEPTTTTEATTTTAGEPTTTTTLEPGALLADCFYAGQVAATAPPVQTVECANAWTSGRQTSVVLQDESERDDSFRTPFMALCALLVFFAAARTVRGWRR